MKRVFHENYRVRAVLAADSPRELGLEIDGVIVSGQVELVVEPQRLGDLGFVKLSDSMVSSDVQGDYRVRAEEMAAHLRRHSYVLSATVEYDERAECSHCGYAWEELTAEHIVRHPNSLPEKGDGPGLPLCCEEAQAEWRAAHKTPAGVVQGFNASDRRELLLSLILRERGEWTPSKVHHVYRGWRVGHMYRSAIRRDLAALCTAGHLTMHDENGRRFFTVKGGAR